MLTTTLARLIEQGPLAQIWYQILPQSGGTNLIPRCKFYHSFLVRALTTTLAQRAVHREEIRGKVYPRKAESHYLPRQCLNLRLLPQGHGSFRPALANAFCNCASSDASTSMTSAGARLWRNNSVMMRIGLSTWRKNAL